MNILITGCAGFIGRAISELLLKKGFTIIGIDNLNNYYSKELKIKRLKNLKNYKKFTFFKIDCADKKILRKLGKKKINTIIHLAAEVGVGNSFANPGLYYENNIKSFFNILEICKIKRANLIFASSSSVYGERKEKFFRESFSTSSPLSFYAATKKCNEVMAYSYSKNYKIACTGIRFFNVYGPWGRPDMSIYKFTKLIKENKKINIFGDGNQMRDFTYIDDATRLIFKIFKLQNHKLKNKFEVYNSGKGENVSINKLVKILEKKLGKKAKVKYNKIRKGDVYFTNSSDEKIKRELKHKSQVDLSQGIEKFIKWYLRFN